VTAIRFDSEHQMTVRRFGAGPEIVWIHGLGESSVSFDPVAKMLDGFTHVLPDLPGYGRSPWGYAPMGLEAQAARLSTWLGERPPAIVIGHSMGGVLATLIAERTRVRAVINIDGNISHADCTFSGPAALFTADDFAHRGFRAMRDDVYRKGVDDLPLRGYHAAMCFASPAVFHRHAGDLVAMSEREDLAQRFGALNCPSLFIAGVPDGISANSRLMLERHNVRWVGIEPAGHWVYLDQPEQFIAALRELFDEI
jgi:pimeloyl-ACP methyl ester carboxylesterase